MKRFLLLSVPLMFAMSYANAGYVASPNAKPHPHHHANHPNPPAVNPPPDDLPPMNYWGGPVVQNAKIYAIFWGPGVNPVTQAGIGGFLRAFTSSTYFDELNRQYNTQFNSLNGHAGTHQSIHHGRFVGVFTINPANKNSVINDSEGHHEISAEIQHQIAIGALPPNDKNTDYMVFLPPNINVTLEFGTACQGYCAYHGAVQQTATPVPGGFINYAVFPDYTPQGPPQCNACASYGKNNDVFNATTYLVSSQIAAGVTDPEVNPLGTPAGGQFPESWIANDGETENTTMCIYNVTKNADAPQATLKTPFQTFEVAPFWLRTLNTCPTNAVFTAN